MNKKTFSYSLKNIPLPSKKSYKLKLIEKVELVIKRMRWKATFFDGKRKDAEQEKTNNFGFKTRKCPPQVAEMILFENDLFNMIKNIKFKTIKSDFLDELSNDLSMINNSSQVFAFADKTRNMYEMAKESYTKLLSDNITKTYKKTSDNAYLATNREAKTIATKLGIADRSYCMAKKPSFITLKDHKENFESSPKCRLINPAKSELGKVSKVITEKLVSAIKDNTNLTQWKNTKSVIEWFKNIENKKSCTFVQFDISEFYPSISEDLYLEAIDFAKQFTELGANDLNILRHCKKSFLFDQNSPWVKKNGNEEFDITMGSFDGAESCELVGLLILNKISHVFGNGDCGLYRDDGLALLRNTNGHESDKKRKELIRIFKSLGLGITIEVNLKTVNFLDVTLNLSDESYRPYQKPNDTTIYINKNSNHPPNITKQLPKTINKRINDISSNKEIFENSAAHYNEALKLCGYTEKLSYVTENPDHPNRPKNRKRNIIWFNPPYSKNVKSDVGRLFLGMISKHFPTEHRYHKIFNKNNIKVSYSCMPDMSSKIKSHNAKIINNKSDDQSFSCNCRNKDLCPLSGSCLIDSVVYRGKITNPKKPETNYIGMTQGHFKDREREHKNSTVNPKKKHSSILASYVWKEKDNNETPSLIEWSIIERVPPFRNGSNNCKLCTSEKYHIIFQPFAKINKRNELTSKCRHENKYYLSNFK